MSDESKPEESTAAPGSSEQELIQIRKDKIERLRALGVNPFGGRFEISDEIGELRGNFAEGKKVTVAGRMTAHRDMGKSHFFDISDFQGRIQCYVNAKGVSEDQFEAFKLLDLGDWIGIEGETFTTQTGEPTVKVESTHRALESPPPDARQVSRRLRPGAQVPQALPRPDVATSAAATSFVKRSLMVARDPRIPPTARLPRSRDPDAAGRPRRRRRAPLRDPPQRARHAALPCASRPSYSSSACSSAGFTKVFELNRNFRNEGISRRHNPEFTMLEAYWAFADFEEMAELVEEMTCHLAEKFCGGLKIEHKDEEGEVTRTIDLTRPWKRASYHDLVKEIAGDEWFDIEPRQRRERCGELGVEISDDMEDYEVTQQVFEKIVEENTFDPLFVTHVPKELVPLAKQNPDDDSVVDVYELIINGQEISPRLLRAQRPDVQRERLEHQAGEETQKVDEEFIDRARARHAARRRDRHRHRPPRHDAHRRRIHPRRRAFPAAEEPEPQVGLIE